MKHLTLTVALAVAFILVALASGGYRKAALVGTTTMGFTALGSMLAMSRVARGPGNAMRRVLAVFGAVFLVRIVLVGVATALVGLSGESVWALVLALFIPYFVFSGVEWAFLHSVRGTPGTNA
jgi:preprotein translocase subunit SecG